MIMFRAFILSVIMIFGMQVALASNVFFPPSGYKEIHSQKGWRIFGKDTESNDAIYVQEIDLNKAKIILYDHHKQADLFEKFKSIDVWPGLAKQLGAYSLSNGSFFDSKANNPTGLSYPYKVGGQVKSGGWATNTDKPDVRMLTIQYTSTGYVAKIVPYNTQILNNKNIPDILGGLQINFDKGIDSSIGRTFVGVIQNFLYILNGASLTQPKAREQLQLFHITLENMMMLDGAGSTQLHFRNALGQTKSLYGCISSTFCLADERIIPQAIVVMPR